MHDGGANKRWVNSGVNILSLSAPRPRMLCADGKVSHKKKQKKTLHTVTTSQVLHGGPRLETDGQKWNE